MEIAGTPLTLLVNPSAAGGRSLKLLPQVEAALDARRAVFRVEKTRSLDHGAELALRAAEVGEVPVVVSGDGLLGVVGGAMAGSDVPLGLIPAGTGNDLGRGIGLDPQDAVAAARVIAAGYARSIDLARVQDTYVGAVLATGFDALVNRRANQMPWPRGSMRYAMATMAELRVFSPLHYRLTLDGQVRELDAMLVAIGNTRSYGGGMLICPKADPYDGLLDVTIIHPVGRLKLLRLFPEMYSGKFVRDPCVEQLRVREVTVEGPGLVGFGDGEMIAAAPLQVCSVPRAVPVYVPHV